MLEHRNIPVGWSTDITVGVEDILAVERKLEQLTVTILDAKVKKQFAGHEEIVAFYSRVVQFPAQIR